MNSDIKSDISACKRICEYVLNNPSSIHEKCFDFLDEFVQKMSIAQDDDEEAPPDPERQTDVDTTSNDIDKRNVYVSSAVACIKNNDLTGALNNYEQAICCAPSAMLYAAKGNIFLKLEQHDAAIADCNTAQWLNSNCAVLYKVRGKAYMAKHDYKKALENFNEHQAIDFSDEIKELQTTCEMQTKVDETNGLEAMLKNGELMKMAQNIMQDKNAMNSLMSNPMLQQMMQNMKS